MRLRNRYSVGQNPNPVAAKVNSSGALFGLISGPAIGYIGFHVIYWPVRGLLGRGPMVQSMVEDVFSSFFLNLILTVCAAVFYFSPFLVLMSVLNRFDRKFFVVLGSLPGALLLVALVVDSIAISLSNGFEIGLLTDVWFAASVLLSGIFSALLIRQMAIEHPLTTE